MKVYLAPYVYWIDDPDDPAIRVGKDGREPFGLVVKCPYLHIIGLNSHSENTVLASSRGQTQGLSVISPCLILGRRSVG